MAGFRLSEQMPVWGGAAGPEVIFWICGTGSEMVLVDIKAEGRLKAKGNLKII